MKDEIAEHREGLRHRLIAVRGERSQRKFGMELGVNDQNINRYEAGKSAPHVDFIILVALKEEVDLNWLLLGRKPTG